MKTMYTVTDTATSIIAHQFYISVIKGNNVGTYTRLFNKAVHAVNIKPGEEMPSMIIIPHIMGQIKDDVTRVFREEIHEFPLYGQGLGTLREAAQVYGGQVDEDNIKDVIASKLYELVAAAHTANIFAVVADAASRRPEEQKDMMSFAFLISGNKK